MNKTCKETRHYELEPAEKGMQQKKLTKASELGAVIYKIQKPCLICLEKWNRSLGKCLGNRGLKYNHIDLKIELLKMKK